MDKGLEKSEIVDITDDILIYLNCSSKDYKVVRKFEYKFLIPLIHVKMYHIVVGNKLHLVEIFSGNKTRLVMLLGTLVVATRFVFMWLMQAMR